MKVERAGGGYSGVPAGAQCLVCEHPDGGSAHFGSTSCLACAAFFRRTVSLNINFECKKDQHCVIFHELRMICRACRFAKCVKAGMRRECVQKRRSNKKVPKKHMMREDQIKAEIVDDVKYECAGEQTDDNSPLSIEKKSPPGLNPTDSPLMNEYVRLTSESTETSTSSEFQKFDPSDMPSTSSAPQFERTPSAQETETTSTIINMNGVELLTFYVNQLKSSMDRRRMIFTETGLDAVAEDLGTVPFETEDPPPHSLKKQYESQRFDNLLAFDFCKCCPGVDLLDQVEKTIFYRSCSLAYCLLDIAWITVQAYKKEADKPVVMYTDGSICTVDDMSYGWDDEEEIGANEKKTLFFNFVRRFNDAICRPIRSLGLTHVEFAALKALCIWKLGYCEFTQGMKVIGKEHEKALLEGLHTYYEDMIDDPGETSVRMGNIILLMGTVFEMNTLIMETYKSAELFALFKLDTLSKSLLTL